MAGERVLGAIITYEPEPELNLHVAALRPQVDELILIDNGSGNAAWVAEVAREHNCEFVGNAQNLGIAGALNQASRRMLAGGFTWLATFDQDSLAPEGLIAGLLRVARDHPQQGKLAVVCASHVDRHTGASYHIPQHILSDEGEWRSLHTTITSGSMMSARALSAIGPFDESLFIDFVDHEYCVRCRRAGWLVVEAKRQVLLHSLGYLTQHRFLGRRIYCSNHSALRRYYMTRNQLEIYRRNLLAEPSWCLVGLFNLAVGSAMVLIFETNRAAKASAMAAGVRDFVLRRFGQRRR